MQYKLTIAIPTYNRAGKLKKCVECILPQIKNKPVELLVNDNASTDNTESLMKRMSNKYGFSYYRNHDNVGPDRNFLLGYERAVGEYVMLLGDDDFLLPGAIESIMKSLDENPVMVHINSCDLLKTEPIKKSLPRLKEEGQIIYHNRDEFFKGVDIFVTFMSSMILKTDYVQKIKNKEKFIGTYFIQSFIAFEVMKNEGKYIINTYNCLAASPNRTVGYDLYFVWGEQYYNLLFNGAINCGIEKSTVEQVYIKDLKDIILNFVLSFRITCKNSRNWEKKYILNHVYQYKEVKLAYKWAVNSPLAVVIIMKIIMLIKRKLNKNI